MTKKERALIDEIEDSILDRIYYRHRTKITKEEYRFLDHLNTIIFKLKYPKLNTKKIEIQ